MVQQLETAFGRTQARRRRRRVGEGPVEHHANHAPRFGVVPRGAALLEEGVEVEHDLSLVCCGPEGNG